MASTMQVLRAKRRAFEHKHGISREHDEEPMDAFSRAAAARNWSTRDTANRYQAYQELIERIQAEQKRVDAAFAKGLIDLPTLNKWLVGLGREPMDTAKKARRVLQTIFINIYDLVDENYGAEKGSLNKLRNYTAEKQLYYPLQAAKSSTVKVFLQRLRVRVVPRK